jgi:hypothetical protein
MIEADVKRDSDGRILIKHLAEDQSDLSFNDFIEATKHSKKGVKFDFKDQDIVEECLAKIDYALNNNPIILNADILPGPGAADCQFDPQSFVKQCSIIPGALLSVGWTTFNDFNNPDQRYTAKMMGDMIKATKDFPGNITFALRVCFMENSLNDLHILLNNDKYSVTYWYWAGGDGLTDEGREWLVKHTDPTRSMYDIY